MWVILYIIAIIVTVPPLIIIIHYQVHMNTELMVSLFIRCTMICEIWAQPAELPQ